MSSLVCLFVVVACAPKEEKPKVAFDTLETNRVTAKDNGTWNATKYRSAHPELINYMLEAQGDSTQTNECPQGDGWASPSLISKEDGSVIKLKCSTVSSAIGCLTDAEFANKPYASDDKQCQPVEKVPFPIPKIAQ